MAKRLRIVVITSCTGEKTVDDERRLTLKDFRRGPKHIALREKALRAKLRAAEDLYAGIQHQRLMRGIRAIRDDARIELDLHILSAGYGLVKSDRKLAPYEATFIGMKKAEAREWSAQLGIPEAIREVLGNKYDLALLLLGDDYLDACKLDKGLRLGGPILVLCGANAAKRLPNTARLTPIRLGNADTTRFSCGLIGLKGEVVARLLERLAVHPQELPSLAAAGECLLDALAAPGQEPKKLRGRASSKSDVDRVIVLPESWHAKPHRKQLSYFIPEWDDLVDRDFDFENDIHSGGTGDWSNEVYAHQMYPEPNYDGILISKVVAEKSKKKKERINALGVHRFLRVPRDFPIMGDCGAFGYIDEYEPPFTTSEILDYYTRLDFDFGVSIDHFAIGEEADRKRRYDLTIQNARDFIVEHKKSGLNWTPIGAVQGWDEASFAKAARQYVKMGYKYIALGAMVRRRTPEILSIVEAVRKVIPAEVKIHLFGVARLNAIQDLVKAGINSADSASLLRRAWMGSGGQNYLSMDGKFYTAIRIPEAGKSFRAKRMVSEGRASGKKVERLEAKCMEAMALFDADKLGVEDVLDVLEEYDHLITPDRRPIRALLRETLEARPWKTCPCDICRRDGIQVVIFRGNNRNRRRGFHNTYVFYHLLQRALAGESIGFGRSGGTSRGQLKLFGVDETEDVEDAA